MVVGQGDIEKTFAIHKDLLVKHSAFFASAFNNDNWKESNNGRMIMEEDASRVFDVFVRFIYLGKLFTMKTGERSESPDGFAGSDQEWARLEKCWVLGEKLLSPSFKDAVTDAAIAKCHESKQWPVDIHQVVYRSSAGPCGMRRLLVDIAVWKWSDCTMSSRPQHVDYMQFFFDVAVAMNQLKHNGVKGAPPFSKVDACFYHDHGDDTPCYKTMF